ncbi:MAG: hypothetical protein AAGE88_18220 [Actinomycetota bacterium]
MPTARTLEQRRRMDLVGQAVAQQAAAVLATANPADIDAWWIAAAPQLRRFALDGSAATARLARIYLAEHAEEADAGQIEPVEIRVDDARVDQALATTGPVAFKTNMARTGSDEAALRVMSTKVTGAVRRLALAGGRETTIATIYDAPQIVGYQRIARAGACDFCTMLANRGAVFLTAERASEVGRTGRIRGTRQVGESYHDSCGCVVEPVYE